MDMSFKRLLGRTYWKLTRNRYGQKLAGWARLPASKACVSNGAPSIALYRTTTGSYYLPTNAPNDVIIRTLIQDEVFEPEILKVAEEFVKPGTTVLDLGANFGQMSIHFSKLVTSTGAVHAFEADPFIFDLLQKNLIENQCHNATAHLGAVFDRAGDSMYYPVQDFVRFSSYGSYGLDPNAIQGRKVPTVTIDSFNIQTPISFAKVDVQGSDLFAMRGAVETIKRHKMPILFEFEQQFQSEFKTSFQDYADFVSQIGYRFDRIVQEINYLIVPR
jgi:FkbM family methyltransferase